MSRAVATKNQISLLGSIIRDARKVKSISQTELAHRLHLNQKTISALENGAEGTEIRTVLLVLDELGLKVEIEHKSSRRAQAAKPERDEVLLTILNGAAELREMGVMMLGLFGSTARGQATPESDIDIAYELSGKPDLFAVGKLRALLQSLFSHKVDLVRMKSLKPQIRSKAEREMIRVI